MSDSKLTAFFDSPSAKAAGAAAGRVGAAADVGTGIAGLIQNRKAREESRTLANEQRAISLEQQERWQKLADRQYENDEERFSLEKKIVTDKNRFDLFFREIDKSTEAVGTIDDSFSQIEELSKTNDDFKNVLLNMFKG